MGAGASAEEFDYDAELQKEPKIVYTTEVKDDGDNKMEGCGPIRRHYKFPDRLVTEPFPEGKNSQEKATTLWWSFQKGLSLAPDNNCLGSRKFVEGKRTDFAWLSYKQVDAEVRDVAAGLASIGVQPKDKIGICGANRPEWTMTGLANYSSNLVTIALYDTLGADALDYIINHAEVRVAFCAPEKTKAIFGILEKCPNLKHVVQFDAHPAFNNVQDAIKEDERKSFADKGVELLGFSELKARGQANNNFKPVPPAEKDIAFIMYTSGTTGVPKGVVLRHESIMASIAGLVQVVQLRSSDVHISYLPLAPILETAVQAGVLCFGASIGFYSGDPRQIMDDIKLLQPTIFPGVPRIFSRIWDKVQSNLRNANCVGRTIFTKCYNGQQFNVRRGLPYNKSYENFFASKVRPNLGLQKCRLVVTGAAPCPPFLMEFLKIVINPKDGVLQGFGMTETSAGISITDPADHTFGQVGPPIPAIEVRLRDVPEMNYFANANPPKGEILVRGMGVFSGYYKMDDATKEVLSDDGWLSTGDVGRWNPNGTLSIIDRKKNIFKLSHGEYIAAEKIENVYGKCPLVGQVFVYGNSYKPFIVGVVVPNVENTMRLLQDKGLWQGPAKLANTPEFRAAFKAEVEKHYDVTVAAIMADLSSEGKKKNLLGFEIVKDITLELELDEVFNGFTIANDCLTPTFKLRRPFLLKRYEPKIRALYEKNGEKCLPSEKWS